MTNFSFSLDLASEEVADLAAGMQASNEQSRPKTVVYDGQFFGREDNETSAEVYFKMLGIIRMPEMTGKHFPFLTVNQVEIPFGAALQGASPTHQYYKTRRVTLENSVNPDCYLNPKQCNEPIREFLGDFFSNEEGYYTGVGQSPAVQELKKVVRGKGATDYSALGADAQKKKAFQLTKKLGIKLEEASKAASNIRYWGRLYKTSYYFLIQPVASKLDEDGNSVPIDKPVILSVGKAAIMDAFGLSMRNGATTIVGGSLIERAGQAKTNSEFSEQEGIPQDASGLLVMYPGMDTTYDIKMRITPGTKPAKHAYQMDFRKSRGVAIKTKLSTPLSLRKDENGNDLPEFDGVPDPIAYAQRSQGDTEWAIDSLKHTFGVISSDAFENKWPGGLPTAPQDIEATGSADDEDVSDRLEMSSNVQQESPAVNEGATEEGISDEDEIGDEELFSNGQDSAQSEDTDPYKDFTEEQIEEFDRLFEEFKDSIDEFQEEDGMPLYKALVKAKADKMAKSGTKQPPVRRGRRAKSGS